MTFPRPWNHTLELFEVWDAEADYDAYDSTGRWTDPRMYAKRDAIVEAMKSLPQYSEDDEGDDDLWWIVDEMSDLGETDEFNAVWGAFYDWADNNRVWVNIHHPAKETAS